MPGTAVIAISDLHLGRCNEQDSFIDQPEQVKRFAEQLAGGVATSGIDLTFVLNGDIFDLWELVSDAELGDGAAAYEAITSGLLVPTQDTAQLDRLRDGVRGRVAAVLGCHREFVHLLKTLIDTRARLHFNVGNHDHQLDNETTAKALIQVLADHGAGAGAGQITVARHFLEPRLGFYAEHGDQFAGSESKSPLRPVNAPALEEATGFYFLRYVWNRLENQDYGWVQHPTLGQILGLVRDLILKRKGPVPLFLRYATDYFRAIRDHGVPLVDNRLLHLLYGRWRSRNRSETLAGARAGEELEYLGNDELTEEDLEAVRQEAELEMAGPEPTGILESVEAPEAAEILEAAPLAEPPLPWLPGLPLTPQPAKGDKYVKGLKGRFGAAMDGFPQLDRANIHTVTLGHTHDERQLRLFGRNQSPVYYNSGSWTKGHTPAYVWSYANGGGPSSGMRQLSAW